MDMLAPAALRVFLADDHPVVLDGMKSLVAADIGLELVGEARDGATALRRACDLRPDVAVLDLSMPGLNGLDVARRLLAAHPGCRILIMTVHEDAAYLRQLFEAGVAGYVLKRSATDELRRAIHVVAEGGVYLDPAIAGRVIAGRLLPQRSTGLPASARPSPDGRAGATAPPTTADQDDDTGPSLSARESEVIRLTAIGNSNKTIAGRLQIGVKSVETYKARAMAKLGFHSRVEVVRYAASHGWLDDP